jgi:hypothetical protein
MWRMDSRYITPEWLLRPQFKLWPPQRHRSVQCVVAHVVLYRAQQRRALILHEYIECLRRMKLKMYLQKDRVDYIGSYDCSSANGEGVPLSSLYMDTLMTACKWNASNRRTSVYKTKDMNRQTNNFLTTCIKVF